MSWLAHWTISRRVLAVLQLAFKLAPLPFPRARQVVAYAALITHRKDARAAPVFVMGKPLPYARRISDIMPSVFEFRLEVNKVYGHGLPSFFL
ncbi:MAG: hypothetical protein HYR70_13425 [Chloroflexi bacterium]|nr:hypothetical protein [Chloroflexota bacterium]MBI3339632.1 hypothetical protein [Chloroflexota bacterium]